MVCGNPLQMHCRLWRLRTDSNTVADVTLGSWMLAFNMHHFDDRRLCDPWCTPSSLAVYNIPQCSGLCNPVQDLVHLHAQPDCHSEALTDGSVPLLPPVFRFDQ